ncbi:MAG: exodeoxyribonuclease VII small subunit [Oscillospiraceae bacterium]|nr:exodeoxyribonuclease VII small subunit [Oscillospiraceae bacterium]
MSTKRTFEDSLERINEISRILSSGEVSLDESIELYQEASELAVKCRKMLDEAELRIAKISRDITQAEGGEG